MERTKLFRILDTVDSTNNYAMAALHAGLATHGDAWFAKDQNAGKGQRGKAWVSAPGENITMSVVIEPRPIFTAHPFVFNMLVANTCRRFLSSLCKDEIKVKWPNDIYIGDRKAGGILIENIYRGSLWKWAVIGMGMNINQIVFPAALEHATSIRKITGETYDSIDLGRRLHEEILNAFSSVKATTFTAIIEEYNHHLFKRQQMVTLRKGNIVFQTEIVGVNKDGKLLTMNAIPGEADFGEVEWIL